MNHQEEPYDLEAIERLCRWAPMPVKNVGTYLDRLKRVPEFYRETQRDRLKPEARDLFAEILNMGADQLRRNRILRGPTGQGKSRCAAALAVCNAAIGAWPVWLPAGEIRSAAFSEWGAARDLIAENSKAALLVIDDLGRGAPSAQSDEIIFQIIDNRITRNLPTVITTMETSDTLPDRFKDHRTAEAVIRRLKELFDLRTL